MSVKNYRFVSPGVFVNEIDNSQVPASPAGIGPVVIGRAASGPALRPVTVNSFEEFVNIFGTPAPGAAGGDVWREGTNKSSTTYGMYAAQAYLRNSSPLTYIRLLGANHVDAAVAGVDNAGWSAAGDAYGLVVFEVVQPLAVATGTLTIAGLPSTDRTVTITNTAGTAVVYTAKATADLPALQFANVTSVTATATSLAACIAVGHSGTITATSDLGVVSLTQDVLGGNGNRTIATNSGDITPAGFTGGASLSLDGALAAILYSTDAGTTFALSGAVADFATITPADGVITSSADAIIRAAGSNKEFKLTVTDYKGTSDLTTTFNFTTTDSRYIRKVLNTNPQLTNSTTTEAGSVVKYFLGETFDRHLAANIQSNTAATTYASIVKLEGGSSALVGSDFKTPLQSAQTPNIISCRLSPTDDPVSLFHIEALEQPGDWTNRNVKISIQDIRRSTNDSTDYGTFSVVVRHLSDSDNVVRIIEQFNNLGVLRLDLALQLHDIIEHSEVHRNSL